MQSPLVRRLIEGGREKVMTTEAPVAAAVPNALQAEDNQPNARRTMEALRELGYDSYASILDLIDNSIDAEASKVDVNISQSAGDIIVTIFDDGRGMDRATLSEALRIGSETDHEVTDLGKFGLGLVTASIGLSRRVEVITKESEGPTWFGCFALDEIAKLNRFVKQLGKASDEQSKLLAGRESGTVVRLSSTDRISNRNTTQFANSLRKRIGQTFRKFLKANRLAIAVNDVAAEAFDPLMLTHKDTRVVLDWTEVRLDGKVVATVKAVELPDLGGAANREQGIIPNHAGFYVVRNNREIIAATTFDFFARHPNYSHYRAEICFDGAADQVLHTDVKKATITPSQAFLDVLRQLTQGLITNSSREARRRSQVERGKVDHSIAESAIPRKAALIPKPKSLVEKRERKNERGSYSRGTGERPRTAHQTQLRTAAGLKVVFNEGNYGEAPFYFVEQQGSTLTITYNRDHLFWREFEEQADAPKIVALVDYLVFALANTELLVPEQAEIVKANMNSTLVGVLS